MNLEPDAWRLPSQAPPRKGYSMSNNKIGVEETPYPAQVRFRVVHKFPPLPEARFKDLVTYRGTTHNFNFLLTPDQVAHLITRFMDLQKEQQGHSRS